MNRTDIRNFQAQRTTQNAEEMVMTNFSAGVTFRVKQRKKNSNEINGKIYRYFRVISQSDTGVLCESFTTPSYKESFTFWDLAHVAEKISAPSI